MCDIVRIGVNDLLSLGCVGCWILDEDVGSNVEPGSKNECVMMPPGQFLGCQSELCVRSKERFGLAWREGFGREIDM